MVRELQLEMERLERDSEPRAACVAAAIRLTLAPCLAEAERMWIDQIENLRAELRSSSRRVQVVDYGAGFPDSPRPAEQAERGVISTATLREIASGSSKSEFWARLLFHLIACSKPSSCLELGARLGISGAYQAAALLQCGGRLATIEGAPALASIARDNFRKLGLDNVTVVTGRFRDVLPFLLESVRPLGFVFIDGHHDEQATLDYFRQIHPALSPGAIVVLDDIRWSEAMQRTWQAVIALPPVSLSVDLGPMGLCVVAAASSAPRRYRLPLVPPG